jgi:hypothetical protein
MNKYIAYLTMVRFLGKLYQEKKYNDLGSVLGDMDPLIWLNIKPIDSSLISEWKRITEFKDLKDDEILFSIIQFIKYLENEFKYNFSKLIKRIKTRNKLTNKQFEESKMEARDIYVKYKSIIDTW